MPVAFEALMHLVRPSLAEPDRSLVERFVAGDHEAFAALVERHGPMVLGVCRRVLGDVHRADDAFQATFLVLARKAGKVRVDGTLVSWLFGAARRVALAARRADERQKRLLHRKRIVPARTQPSDWDDLLQLLDEELVRLPDKYRAPLLACYLHGRTQDEAARALGWSVSTLRRRLERGRALLKARLTARGAALSAGLFAGALAPTARATVPDGLRQATVAIAIRNAAVPELIDQLAKEGVGMSSLTRWGIAITALAAACGLAIGIGIAASPQKPSKVTPAPAPPPAAEVKRDRFNDPLPPRAIARMGTVGFHHRGGVHRLAYTPSGETLISTGGGSITLWDAKSGHERTSLGGTFLSDHEWISDAKLMPDGKSLLVYPMVPLGGGNARGVMRLGRAYLWDLDGQREARKFTVSVHGSRGDCQPRLLAPDGSAMAEVQSNGDVYLWEMDGTPSHILKQAAPAQVQPETHAAFAFGGKSLVTVDGSHLVRVWDTKTGELIRSIGGGLTTPAALALAPDGKRLATIAKEEVLGAALGGAAVPEKIRIWDLATGKLTRAIPWGDESWMSHRLFLSFSTDGESLIVVDEFASDHLEMRRWRVDDGELIRRWTVPGPNVGVGAVAFDPNGKTVAIGAGSGVVRLFDLETGQERTPIDQHLAGVKSIALSADQKELRTAAYDDSVRAWEISSGQPLRRVRTEGYFVRLTTASDTIIDGRPPGKTALLDVKIRDLRSGEIRQEIKGLNSCVLAPDGNSIWAKNDRGDQLGQWDLATGAMQRSFPIKSGWPIAVTNGGRLVVMADKRRIIGIETATGTQTFDWVFADEKLLERGFEDPISSWVVSADGRFIVMIMSQPDPDRQRRVSVRELSTGKVIWKPAAPDLFGNEIAFRPDGKVIATGSDVVKLYDAATGKQLAELDGHRGSISALAFSTDGKCLASGGHDGLAMVWNVADINP